MGGNILKAFGVKAVPPHKSEVKQLPNGATLLWDHLTVQMFGPEHFLSSEHRKKPSWTWVFQTAKSHGASMTYSFKTADPLFPTCRLFSVKKIPFFGNVEVTTYFRWG